MRRLLSAALLLATVVYLTLLRTVPVPLLPEVRVSVKSPYTGEPLLGAYEQVFQAKVRGDLKALQNYVETATEDFLLYRTLLQLARSSLPAGERMRYLERVLAFELVSPLARDDARRAQLELARITEDAGRKSRALDAYAEALPLDEAARGLVRLETDPRTLATIFLEAREYERTLAALGSHPAPAIRARCYAALGEHKNALNAYNRWLERSPGSRAAREGKVWTLIALGRYAAARRVLSTADTPPQPSAEAALAVAQDDPEAALEAYMQMGQDGLWKATELLERRGDTAAALPYYLELARTETAYQDDAAYRAYTLARRLGDEAATSEAAALVPAFSFFGLLLGSSVPFISERLPRVTPPALARSRALVRAGDDEAALGELLIALKRAPDEATTVALAEALQDLGEYGASSEAADLWLGRGSRSRRTWLSAYPRAYSEIVQEQAARWDVEPSFIWAVMRQESHFYPRAFSTSDAQGLMQLIPSTWDWLAELLEETPGDPFDASENVRYGTFYLSKILATFSKEESSAAYNGGPGYIGRLLDEPYIGDEADFYRFIGRAETREYLQQVMLNEAVYKALY